MCQLIQNELCFRFKVVELVALKHVTFTLYSQQVNTE
jgi:hypothetical protein